MVITENERFMRLVQALHPWLDKIVIVGGWAHRLYRLHPLAQRLDFPPLTTLDTDIAIPAQLEAGQEDVNARLKAEGFEPELLGEHHPPVTHYTLGEEGNGFYAEFLTPLIGGLENRGKNTATITIAGVNSQKLRHLELLLHAPWQVKLGADSGFAAAEQVVVQIPNATSYLAQKLLIHERRDLADRAKDVIYIHDTIQTFGRSLKHLEREWLDNVKPLMSDRAVKKVVNSADMLFAAVTDGIREATVEAGSTGRSIVADDVQKVCHAGLKQIFV